MAKCWPQRAAEEDLAHVTQHVIAYTFGARRVHIAVDNLQSVEGVGGQPEQCGKEANFDHHDENRGRRSFDHARLRIGAARIELHHASGVGDRFHPRQREHDSDKRSPVLPKRSMQRLQMSKCLTKMRQTKETENNHDEGGWNRNQERKTASLFGA